MQFQPAKPRQIRVWVETMMGLNPAALLHASPTTLAACRITQFPDCSGLSCAPPTTSRAWQLSSTSLRLPSTHIGPSQYGRGFSRYEERKLCGRGVHVRAKGKGFGELLQKKRKGGSEVEKSEKWEESSVCSCGGGDEGCEYALCCARYHGGVNEPDATTLMKARFSAYARSKIDYVVRTTHPDHPDFEGEKRLADDVRATCERLRFTKLDILASESTADDEAFVSFRATYSLLKGGRGGDRKQLVEKSRFVKEGDRWFYRERIPLSQASTAAWLTSTTPNYVDPEVSRKSFGKSKPQGNLAPRRS